MGDEQNATAMASEGENEAVNPNQDSNGDSAGDPSGASKSISMKAWPVLAREWLTVGACLLVFCLVKLRDLSLPYFWDEVGVYARAALYLHDHGLGLLPRDLPPELSRGHPLLLAFAVAAAFRAFGATPLVGHAVMLAIATALLLSTYRIARCAWGHGAGLLAMILLMVQPLFLAQSTLVLPEVPLALACLWALHALVQRKALAAGLWATLAFFVKETALVLNVVFIVFLVVVAAVDGRRRKDRGGWASSLRLLGPVLLANALCAAFFLVQKSENGWYFFPEHLGYVDFHWTALARGLRNGLRVVLIEQGRWVLSGVVMCWATVCLRRWAGGRTGQGRALVLALCVFGMAVLIFSAGNVFMKRYLLCVLPPVAMVAGRSLAWLGQRRRQVGLAAAGVACVACLSQAKSSQFNCENDLGFREAVRIQQQATAYVAEHVGTEHAILANFPTYAGLEDPRYGYARRRFARPMCQYRSDAEYIFASEIFQRFEPPAGVQTTLVKRFASPYMTIALYRIVR